MGQTPDPTVVGWQVIQTSTHCSLKRTVQSKAFINLNTPADVLEFKSKFDGHTFISNRGQQFHSTVEYAPFQKVPAPSSKKAPMEGTIEKGAYLVHYR